MSLGKNIKQLRLDAEMSQESLSLAVSGSKQSYVSKWEKGKNTPTLADLLKLAVALNVSLDDLVIGLNTDYDVARGALGTGAASSMADETPADDQAASRIVELEGRIKGYEALFRKLATLSETARNLASNRGESGAPVRAQQRRRVSNRRRDRRPSGET